MALLIKHYILIGSMSLEITFLHVNAILIESPPAPQKPSKMTPLNLIFEAI